MKRIIISVLVVLLIVGMALPLTSCTAMKDVETAKAVLEEYFEALDDEDYDDLMDLFHDDLLDDLGGEDEAEALMMFRRKLAGAIDDYSVVGTEFESSGGETLVTFDVETSYEREEEIAEELLFLVDDDDVLLVGIDLEELSIYEKTIDDFIAVYKKADLEALVELFNPIFFDYSTEDDFKNVIEFTQDMAGDYVDHEIMYDTVLLEEMDGKAMVLAEVAIQLYHNSMDMLCHLQVSVQDDNLGLNFVNLEPAIGSEFGDGFYGSLASGDVDLAMALYDAIFFDNTEGGRAGWRDYLSQIIAEYGVLENYEYLNWYFDEVLLEDGTQEKVLYVEMHTQYGEVEAKEVIGIAYELDEPGIIYHSIEKWEG